MMASTRSQCVRTLPLVALMTLLPGCSALVHGDLGYAQRATSEPHRAVTFDGIVGFGVGDDESGVGGALAGRIRVGDGIGSVAAGPGGYGLLAVHERIDLALELGLLGGMQSLNGKLAPVFLPTLRGGMVIALEDPKHVGLNPVKRLFVLAMTDYALQLSSSVVNAPSFGLSVGYGFAGHH